MRLSHLNLRVADAAVTRDFYCDHFGFSVEFEAEEGYFLRSPDGFLLAIVPAVEPVGMPEGFHLGFSTGTAEEVSVVRRALAEAGVRVGPVDDARPGEDYVTFRCWDPDGTEVEVFWDGA